MLTPKHYERSILAAEAADFPHYASVLRSHYALDFPEPAAAFAAQRQPPAPLPVFRNVTGPAFGVAMAAARARGNHVSLQIQAHRARLHSPRIC